MHTPASERCNGVDDNCDGTIDETWGGRLGQPCAVGFGACLREGERRCSAAGDGVECSVRPGEPTAELCNGADDDCDGEVDEIFGLGEACEVGQGLCLRVGRRICVPLGADGEVPDPPVACNVEPGQPEIERCNGTDDDCDGRIDEAFAELGQPCVSEAFMCPSPGFWACNGGGDGLICDAREIAPIIESCNGEDDDCDAEIDEDFPELGTACSVGVGGCAAASVMTCDAAGLDVVCDATPGEPEVERCDGIDNDCDGRVDNGARCETAPLGVVSEIRIADADDPACADWDGDLVPDNALAAVAELFNGPIADSIASGGRLMLIRAPGMPAAASEDGATFRVEFLDGLSVESDPGGGGAIVRIDHRGLDAVGDARAWIDGVRFTHSGWTTESDEAVVRWMSPFFFDRDHRLETWSRIAITGVRVAGTPILEIAGGLGLEDGVLTGTLEIGAILADLRAGAAACRARASDEGGAPTGCGIFDAVDADAVASALTADVDRSGDGLADAVSACFRITAVPAPDVDAPPAGGQPCSDDTDCLAGLVCRPVPVIEDPALGAALALRCGVPGNGDADDGETCEEDNDCRSAVCGTYSAAGGHCSRLCERTEDCPASMVCRGAPIEVEGARTRGGATARICVAGRGSGLGCEYDGDCPVAEVCGPWLGGQVGVPGGRISSIGACQAPDDGGEAGTPCETAADCRRADACVVDLRGVRRCLDTCGATAHCTPGYVCRDRPIGSNDVGLPAEAEPAVHGFCIGLDPGAGSGTPCQSEFGCPGAETCIGQFLRSVGRPDRYCARGEGFFTVGQTCAAHADCASGRCIEGLCSGICDDNDDCGSRLGCREDAAVATDDTGETRIVGGQCDLPDTQCGGDNDCRSDALCGEDRCICAGGACAIGCRSPIETCPAGLFCQTDNTCAPFCRDDPNEPNEDALSATLIPAGRAIPLQVDRRRLCVSSSTDWYGFNPGGVPFSVVVSTIGGDEAISLDVELIDAAGNLVSRGASGVVAGRWTATVDDPQAAAAFVDAPIYVRVRGAGLSSVADYEMRVELSYPDCPDSDPLEPRDESWQWQPLAAEPGDSAHSVVDQWLCNRDEDWFAVYVGNDDEMNLDFEVLEPAVDGSVLVLELFGPDFPGLGERVIETIELRAGESDSIQFIPEQKFCNEDEPVGEGNNQSVVAVCAFPESGVTQELCIYDADCAGSTYFIRVRGADPLSRGHYELVADVSRLEARACVPDPFEYDNIIDFATRVFGGVSPHMLDMVRGLFPSVHYGETLHLPHMTMCQGQRQNEIESDAVTLYMEVGDQIHAEFTQTAALQEMVIDIRYVSGDGLPMAIDVGRELVMTLDAEAATAGLYAITSHPGEALVGQAEYDLRITRQRAGFVPDPGCDAPERIVLNPATGRAVVNGTNESARDDHRPHQCFGGFGADLAYRVATPGPGTLRVQARALSRDSIDPAVYVRSFCDAPETELGCNEDDTTAVNPLMRAVVEVEVVGGEYFVIVDSFSPDDVGRYELTVNYTAFE